MRSALAYRRSKASAVIQSVRYIRGRVDISSAQASPEPGLFTISSYDRLKFRAHDITACGMASPPGRVIRQSSVSTTCSTTVSYARSASWPCRCQSDARTCISMLPAHRWPLIRTLALKKSGPESVLSIPGSRTSRACPSTVRISSGSHNRCCRTYCISFSSGGLPLIVVVSETSYFIEAGKVFADDVEFDIHTCAHGDFVEVGVFEGVGDDCHAER